MDVDTVSNLTMKRLEMKIRELESKLELELTTKGRMDTQIGRLKETIERLNKEIEDIRIREQSSQDQQKKLGRQLRDIKEDYASLQVEYMGDQFLIHHKTNYFFRAKSQIFSRRMETLRSR